MKSNLASTAVQKNDIPTEMLIEDGAIHGFMTYGKEFDENITKLLVKVKESLKKFE